MKLVLFVVLSVLGYIEPEPAEVEAACDQIANRTEGYVTCEDIARWLGEDSETIRLEISNGF